MSMFCDDCGHELDANGTCPICGFSKSAASLNQPVTPSYGHPANSGYGQTNNRTYGQPNNQAYAQGGHMYGQTNPTYAQPNNRMYGQQNPTYAQTNSAGYAQGGSQMYGQTNPTYGQAGSQMYGQAGSQMYGQAGYGQPYRQVSNPPAGGMSLSSPQKKQKKKWPIITGISALVAAIAVTVVLVVSGGQKNRSGKPTSAESTEERTERTTEAATEATTEAPMYSEGTRTIMIYIVGSNLESQGGCASTDIDEILNASYNEDDVNILLCTGGCYDWSKSVIPDNENAYILVENGSLSVLDTETTRNMGDPSTLADFLNYGYSNFPAEQYDLICWNHGGGAFFGFGLDERTNDSLTLEELSAALSATPFQGDNKLEWIGFDACLMATIETADALSPYARYLVASQEPEPGWGWDYSFLSDISNTWDGVTTGRIIADYFIDTTSDLFASIPFSYSDITMSVLDLDKVDEVEEALDDLFAQVTLDDASYTKYSRIRTKTKEIASDYSGEQSYDVIDLMSFAQNLEQYHLVEAKALEEALDELIVYNHTNEVNANGVSIYHPYHAKEYSTYLVPMYYTFDFAEEYAKYIAAFSTKLNSENTLSASWDAASMIPYMTGYDYFFSLQLTDEQADCYQKASYVISRADEYEPGNYVFVAMNTQVDMDSSNTITAGFDGQIIYVQNNTTGEICEVMYTEQETTEDYTRYLLTTILYNDNIDGDDAMYAYFVLETTPSDPTGHILGAYPLMNYINTDGAEIFPDRYEIDISEYKNIAFGCASHKFTSEEDLTNFNESDWSDVNIWYTSFPVSDGFSTTLGGMISDIPYYGMFIIEDSQGNRHCSNLVELK